MTEQSRRWAGLTALVIAASASAQTPVRVTVQPPVHARVPSPATVLPRVAVLDFSNGTVINADAMNPLRRALGATLAGAIARSGRADVIERNRMREIVDELDLAGQGRIDDGAAARAGKLLGVDYLFLGAFIVQPNGDMLVSTRLVDVSTALVTAGPDATGNTRSATRVIAQLADRIAKQLRWPADTSTALRTAGRDSPAMTAAIDSLVIACDAGDRTAASAARANVERLAAGHPALHLPCR